MRKLSSQDLDNLITEKLHDCKGYSNICEMMKTETGVDRLKIRVKQIINDDGITSIDAVLAQIETELRFDEE